MSDQDLEDESAQGPGWMQLGLDLKGETYWPRREKGIAKATRAATTMQQDLTDSIIELLFRSMEKVYSGDFWGFVADYPTLYASLFERRRMVNGRWGVASRRGLGRKTFETKPSPFPTCNNQNPVWESLVYDPAFDVQQAIEDLEAIVAMLSD